MPFSICINFFFTFNSFLCWCCALLSCLFFFDTFFRACFLHLLLLFFFILDFVVFSSAVRVEYFTLTENGICKYRAELGSARASYAVYDYSNFPAMFFMFDYNEPYNAIALFISENRIDKK